MTREEFFEKFELFAELPDAVAKMRQLILDLAVSAQLTEQRADEEPASILLARAALERERLVAAKTIKGRPTAPLPIDETPFKVPPTWSWARLSDVGHELGQKVPGARFSYIDVGSIDSVRGRITDSVLALGPDEAPSRARKIVAMGTVIYSTVRPYLRNIAVVDRQFECEAIASTAFGILHPFADIASQYLFIWLRSSAFTSYVESSMKGMAYPAINDEAFYRGPIGVPPLAEQKRIVAKVDELMALCDQLEAQQKERETRHAALARASLSRFTAAPIPRNLDLFFHKAYAVTPTELRDCILDLAVRGNLVPQDPKDEPAGKVLAALDSEREAFLRSRGRRRKASAETVRNDDIAFSLPGSWRWRYLHDLCFLITDGAHHTPRYQPTGVPFLSVKDVSGGSLDFSRTKFISADEHLRLARRCKPERGDVILTKIGTTGIGVLVDDDREFSLFVSLALLKFPQAHLDGHYLTYVLNSPFVRRQSAAGTQGVGNKNLVLRSINRFTIPIPPIAEQRRIVAKLDELMLIVGELETQLSGARRTAIKLLNAVVGELQALEPRSAALLVAATRAS